MFLADATGSGRRRRLISLTPLIDVVFILLLFFLLASHIGDRRSIKLDLKPAAGVRTPRGLQDALRVRIETRGVVRLGGEVLGRTELAARIRGAVARVPDVPVVLIPGPEVSVQRVIEVWDGVILAGARNVSWAP